MKILIIADDQENVEPLYNLIKGYHSGNIDIQAVKTKFEYKNRFLIHLGSRMFFINTADIAYFYVSEKIVYLVNIDGARYPIDYSLEKIQQIINPSNFFRINRRVICSAQAIKEIKTHINSRLKIILSVGNYLDEAVVSREKVTAFKEWVEG